EKVMHELQSLAPSDTETLMLQAEILEAKENFLGSAETYRKILQSNPKDPEILTRLGDQQIKAGMKKNDRGLIQEGFHTIERAIQYDATFYLSYYAQGWAFHVVPQIRDLSKAKTFYQKALHYFPRDVSSLTALSDIAIQEGDLEGAVRTSEKALQINPKD